MKAWSLSNNVDRKSYSCSDGPPLSTNSFNSERRFSSCGCFLFLTTMSCMSKFARLRCPCIKDTFFGDTDNVPGHAHLFHPCNQPAINVDLPFRHPMECRPGKAVMVIVPAVSKSEQRDSQNYFCCHCHAESLRSR